MAEREQGITIDVAYRYFSTEKRSFIVADTPGHEEYTRNMAVGASFADLAIILVDAVHGVLIQTRRHARICSLMGIKHFVFAVNKMDLAGYSEARFAEVTAQITEIVTELDLQDVVIIPVSATEGDNVTEQSSAMPWYTGKTILAHLETVNTADTADGKGFILPVQRVCRPNHDFRGFMGQIESGRVATGDELTALPSGEHARVKKIVRGFSEVTAAVRGQAVNIVLDREVDVSRGCVLTRDTELPISDSVTATVLWMDDARLENGKSFYVKIGTKQIPAIVTAIHYAVDVNTGEHKKAVNLSKNEIASVDISFTEPIVVDAFKRNHTLGELILIDRISNMTSACGVVTEVAKTNAENNSGKVDRRRRAALNVQTPLVAEFVLGKNGVTEELVAAVEKRLCDAGRHTYRYLPSAKEDFAAVAEHLFNAGLVVLLALDERLAADASDARMEKPWWYAQWQQHLVQVDAADIADILLAKTAFSVLNGNDYAI